MLVKKFSYNLRGAFLDFLLEQYRIFKICFSGEIFDYIVSSLERRDMSQGDVILRCEDGSIPCHKVVLAALSPMLETILRVTGEEPTTIFLPDIKLSTLTTFLAEFYQNSVSDVNTEMASLLGFKLQELACDSSKTLELREAFIKKK